MTYNNELSVAFGSGKFVPIDMLLFVSASLTMVDTHSDMVGDVDSAAEGEFTVDEIVIVDAELFDAIATTVERVGNSGRD